MKSVFFYILGQSTNGRFGLYDLLVDQLLLQVSPSQTPQIVNLLYGSLRQEVVIII